MGTIKTTKTLFFVTSPRSPEKLIPEIKLLAENFSGQTWNAASQEAFMLLLVQQEFFQARGIPADPALSARDRITRSPQGLGFVDLKPKIQLTPAGAEFINSRRPEEILTRQLMKFQLPSIYHKPARDLDCNFWCKPYLELLRLIRHFGSLTFDELQIFGLQLTDYRKFDEIVAKIENFRKGKALTKDTYAVFSGKVFDAEIKEIYKTEFESGAFAVRETRERTEKKFLTTKKRNARDYTDAFFRCMAMTGLTSVSQSGHSLGIAKDRIAEVDHLLNTIPRDPLFVNDQKKYKAHLFDATTPALLTDDTDAIKERILELDRSAKTDGLAIAALKDLHEDLLLKKKNSAIEKKVEEIKDMREYDDIMDVFDRIRAAEYYDNPLMFEWNAWRAMTMLDGGNIVANLNFDDNGEPLSIAPGNGPDIVCDYGDFMLNVEVTLQSGQKQYDNEGEPVARHLGKTKQVSHKDTYCLFVAPTISDATIAHFYALQHVAIKHYGGKATVIPLNLSTFEKMIRDTYKAKYKPNPQNVLNMIERFKDAKNQVQDELEWFTKVQKIASSWLECE